MAGPTAPVATTLTAADKQEEVRKLHLEIAGLISTKEIAARAAQGAQDAAEDARSRAEALEGTIAALEASQAGAAKELREFVADCRNVLQTVVSTMELAAQSAKDLSAEIDKLVNEITKRQKELENLREAFAKENESMSIKREDLDIWEGRVRAAAAIHLPGVEIKV